MDMAEVVTLVDDLDRTTTEGVETVTLSLAGKIREVDLSPEHREELEKFLAPYIEAGRTVRSSGAPTSAPASTRAPMTMKYSPETMAEATAWAKSDEGEKALEKAGVKYSGVGRTPYAVVEEYLKTQA